jgi:hypothetical protein
MQKNRIMDNSEKQPGDLEEKYEYVRLLYSPDTKEEEAYMAYQECMLEQMEKHTAENPTEADFLSGAGRGGMDNLNFKTTPSPNTRHSAVVPLTQPPPPLPRASFAASQIVPPSAMHGIFKNQSYRNASGRRSAPPMLP